MSQLTLVILLAIAAYLAWGNFKRAQRKKMQAQMQAEARRQQGRPQPGRPPVEPAERRRVPETAKITTLEKDPETGVYRPVERRD